MMKSLHDRPPRGGGRGTKPYAAPMVSIHESASVEDDVVIGDGTRVWSNVQIRRGARIGTNCVFGRNSFVDVDVTVGDNVKVQNNARCTKGVGVEDGVFIGPHVIFTNDKVPRAINPDGRLKSADDWELGQTHVCHGAAIGAGAVVVTGVTIGRWAMIGSGAVVTRDVPDHALVVGNPGRVVGWVSAGGVRCASQEQAAALECRRDDGPRSVRAGRTDDRAEGEHDRNRCHRLRLLGPEPRTQLRSGRRAAVVAVCDQRAERLAVVEQALPGGQHLRRRGRHARRPTVDAVVIATPVSTHFELAMQALGPASTSSSRSRSRRRSSRPSNSSPRPTRAGSTLMVDHTFIYTSAVRKIYELVDRASSASSTTTTPSA